MLCVLCENSLCAFVVKKIDKTRITPAESKANSERITYTIITCTIICNMKPTSFISFHTIFLATLCLSLLGCKKNISNDLIVFDVTANPVKTLDIEDVADIAYLTLEVKDDYLFRFFSAMTDNYIICVGRYEIVFFDRSTGKVVSKVSRRGNGPGEYNAFARHVYDEKQDELFITILRYKIS